MRNGQRFSFTEGFDAFGVPDALPLMPLSLTYRNSSVNVSALLDTGASVNVLPLQCWHSTWCSVGRTNNFRDFGRQSRFG